jgi:SpoOM protein
MTRTWTTSAGGAEWTLELARDRLLPGRLVDGRVTVTARRAIAARGLVVTLLGEEHWKYHVTTTDAEGHTQTETRTGRADLPRVPVLVAAPIALAAGETRTFEVQLPVPGLGPATLEADVAGVTWTVEAKLDIEGGRDSSLEVPVRILQPTALLRAGVVHVGEFALFEAADAQAGGVTGSIEIDPVPLVPGQPFRGRLTLRPATSMRLQEIRTELRVKVESTVSGGFYETIVPWTAVVAPAMELATDATIEFTGAVPDVALPTIELPHGRASASVHVILARAWARDPHLVRDLAIATTLEI